MAGPGLYRGAEPEWELVTPEQMSFGPNVRAKPSDYPVRGSLSWVKNHVIEQG